MPVTKDYILHHASTLRDEVIRLRRYFHRHPELSYVEYETSRFIREWLDGNNIPYRHGIAGTGIIACITGNGKGSKVVAARAELDALPINEQNQTEYASVNHGVMHACGHDAHMAMLMGTALVMNAIRDSFGGSLLLIFQPGEEKSPGGARLMKESGELNNPRPDIIIAQHILPELETGKTGYKSGRYMASCDELYITVSGKGGHAALPGMSTDQVYIASQLVVRLKDRMKEKQNTVNIPTVLGIGKISGEGATNVIPAKVEIAGTFRTFDEKWRREALDFIREVAADTAAEFGISINVKVEEGYPVLVNDEDLTMKAVELSTELLGAGSTALLDTRMSSDDFSFYSALAPSLYYRIGIRRKGSEMKKLHTSDFDLDEDALVTGVANLSWLINSFLIEG